MKIETIIEICVNQNNICQCIMKPTERELGGYMRIPEWCQVKRTRSLVPEKCRVNAIWTARQTHYEANSRFSKFCECA
jgi:hypothetical protein